MFYNTPLLHLRKIAVRESNFQGKRLEKGCLKHSISTTFGVNSYLFCFTLFLLLTPCHLKKIGHIPAPVCYFSLYLCVVRSFLWLLKWKLLSLDQLKKIIGYSNFPTFKLMWNFGDTNKKPSQVRFGSWM